jgi:hypothetical protein
MRRWFSSQLVGALLALVMVVVSTSTAFADPRDFTLINGTGQIIEQVYVAPSNLDDWGDDILGIDILEAGQSVNISFQRYTEGDCYYDIKVITGSGAEGELNQVNLCETTTVTFN